MRIIYVHHAQRQMAGNAKQDDDLTPLGIKDAEIASQYIKAMEKKNIKVKEIITSPYLRCFHTAEIINKHLNVPIKTDPRLNEFFFASKETWIDVQSRIRDSIKDVVFSSQDDEAVIFVTSGINVAAFISLAYKLPPSDNAPFIGVPSCCLLGFDITKANFE